MLKVISVTLIEDLDESASLLRDRENRGSVSFPVANLPFILLEDFDEFRDRETLASDEVGEKRGRGAMLSPPVGEAAYLSRESDLVEFSADPTDVPEAARDLCCGLKVAPRGISGDRERCSRNRAL